MTPTALSKPVTRAKGVMDNWDKSPFVAIKKHLAWQSNIETAVIGFLHDDSIKTDKG